MSGVFNWYRALPFGTYRRQRQALPRDGWPADVPAQPLELLALIRPRRHAGVQGEPGALNRMVQDIDHMLWYENASVMDLAPYRTGAWLADRPCTAKGVKDCIWPVQAMRKLLAAEAPTPDGRT